MEKQFKRSNTKQNLKNQTRNQGVRRQVSYRMDTDETFYYQKDDDLYRNSDDFDQFSQKSDHINEQCEEQYEEQMHNQKRINVPSKRNVIIPSRKRTKILHPDEVELSTEALASNDNKKLKEVLDKNRFKFFIDLFYQKASRNNPERKPIQYDPYHLQFKDKSIFLKNCSVYLPKQLEYCIIVVRVLLMVILLISFPLSLVFEQLLKSSTYQMLDYTCLIFSVYDILNKIFIKKVSYEKKKVEYLQKSLILDVLTSIALTCTIAFQHIDKDYLHFLKLFMLTKFITYFQGMQKIELYLFSGSYIEKYWNLIKVFFSNLMICHFIAILLIATAQFKGNGTTWMSEQGINHLPWYETYVYSYYFGITIITTIGFGDFHASNPLEALILIFICIFSCVFCGYNINLIGNLINNIKAQEVQKQEKLQALNQLTKKADISQEVYQQISKYIVESTKIKKQFNLQQEASLLACIPTALRSTFLQETNLKLFHHLKNIVSFNNRTIEKLALSIQAKICHPEETIKNLKSLPNLMILQNGAIAFTSKKNKSLFNNLVIEEISTKFSEDAKIICIDVLSDEKLNYQIKSLDYSLVHMIDGSEFEENIRLFKQDYEIYKELKDKCKFQLNQFGLVLCKMCKNKKHTLFECPKLHFMPLKQSTVYKYLKKNKDKPDEFKQVRTVFYRVKDKQSTKAVYEVIDKVVEENSDKSIDSNGSNSGFRLSKSNGFLNRISQKNMTSLKDLIKEEVNKIKNIQNEDQFKFSMWDLENCDTVHNYSYYFAKQNIKQVSESFQKANSSQVRLRTSSKSNKKRNFKKITTQTLEN